ncbi:MAG: M13-type metalloendopeptidase [Kineosporiaceae bacterium]
MRSGIDTTHLDTAVRLQDDLFGHVNGGWLATVEIPPDRSRYGSFDMLREASELAVRELIEEAAASIDAGSAEQDGAQPDDAARRVGGLYRSFMDVDRVAELGWSPLIEDLRRIAAVATPSDIVRTMAHQQRHVAGGLVGVYVSPDAGDPEHEIAYLSQSGLGLPDEEYYRADQHAAVREAYQAYLARMLDLAAPALAEAGLDLGGEASAVSARVMALETMIAGAHWDKIATRDAVKSYTRMTREELEAASPGWDWPAWLAGLQARPEALAQVVVRQPDMLTAVSGLLTSAATSDWQAWLTVRLVNGLASYLTDDVVETHFDFYGRTLSGTPQLRERWKRAVGLVEGLLGEDAGQMYVARHYPPHAHARMEALVANVVEAFRVRIGELEWMGEQTRAEALDKLAAFRPKIGHPARWRDYSAFVVDPADLIGNVRRGAAVETDRQLAKIGRPVDTDEWLMTPQTVNAYYHPTRNEIVFPAAILQPPFFDVEADDAANYGGIGAVIAHEIGHGFDDQGSRFDGTGALTDWWTADDRAAFDALAGRLIAQFDGLYTRNVADQPVKGALTVGENIGDLCGLEMALAAYRLAAGDDGRAAPELDGWTGVQRFFLGWAQVWRTAIREAEARRLLSVDPHSPADLRANAVRNVAAFHEAFATAEGDGLWLAPEDRVRIF